MPYMVDTMDKCERFLVKLHTNGWSLWQMQYRWDLPEGFHAWFGKEGEKDIELVTFKEDIQDRIVRFNKAPG